MMERIVEFDQTIADHILTLMTEGLTTSKIVRQYHYKGYPTLRTMREWRSGLHGAPGDFAVEFHEARGDQSHALAHRCVDIADTAVEDAMEETIAAVQMADDECSHITNLDKFANTVFTAACRARGLQIETRKFLAQHYNPNEFGERVAIQHETPKPIQHVDLSELSVEQLEQFESLSESIAENEPRETSNAGA